MKLIHRIALTSLLLSAMLGMWAAPALAGGWAVATLDEIPSGIVAGEPFTVGFTMRQHGIRPVDWGPMTMTFTHAASGQVATVTAMAENLGGHYSVEVTLPASGTWGWTIGEGLVQPLPSLEVAGAAIADRSADAMVGSVPLPAVVGLLGLAGVAIGLVILFRTRRPWATALTLSAALVAGLGFTSPPSAPLSSGQPPATASYGEALFLAKGCVMCHAHTAVADVRRKTIGAFNSFSTGPDLSNLSATPEFLHAWLKNPAAIKPKTMMPQLDLSDAEIDALVAFLNSDTGK